MSSAFLSFASAAPAALADRREFWGVLVIGGIAVLFGVLYWLSHRIEPDTRKTENDEYIRKGRRP